MRDGSEIIYNEDRRQVSCPKGQAVLSADAWNPSAKSFKALRSYSAPAGIECLPPDPFGDIEQRVLALKKSDQPPVKSDNSVPQVRAHKAMTVCQSLLDKCEKLTAERKQSPYAESTGPHVPKCNWFINDVLKTSGIPVPWDAHCPPDVHGMNAALSKDPRYEKVWARSSDERNWPSDARRFMTSFKPLDSDILIWDNRYLQHTGIAEETLDGHGNTYYAGRDTASGLGYSDLPVWWVSSQVKGYGAPDAIYRYKNLSR